MSLIRAEHLSFSYSKNTAPVLNDVSFLTPEGKITGIIGPNGSGKTTLLRCISGYLVPNTGKVFLDERNVRRLSTHEISKSMALVQQQFSTEYDFSVSDIVLTGRNPYVRKIHGESEEDYEIARESMRLVGIEELSDRSIFELSGGERQLVMLARAICQSAPVMLLDEPVTGLDIRHQIQFLNTVRQMSQQKTISVICVLHDLNLCMSFCDHVLLLKDGKVFAEGDPGSVLTRSAVEEVYQTSVIILEKDGRSYILPGLSGEK
jgi:iron complex transport system ATP-binding protein